MKNELKISGEEICSGEEPHSKKFAAHGNSVAKEIHQTNLNFFP